MKWILFVVIFNVPPTSAPSITLMQFPTLKECFATGKNLTEFANLGADAALRSTLLAKFMCQPSDGSITPACGLHNQEPCK